MGETATALRPKQESTATQISHSADVCVSCTGTGWSYTDHGVEPCACAIERIIASKLPLRFRLAELADFDEPIRDAAHTVLSKSGTRPTSRAMSCTHFDIHRNGTCGAVRLCEHDSGK